MYRVSDAGMRRLMSLENIFQTESCRLDHEALKKSYYTRTPFAHPSVMYRRQLIEKAGYYPTDTMFMEDNVLWGRALIAGLMFANIPEYLIKFRIDQCFYRRRSGIRYGWNFIKMKMKFNKMTGAPLYSYPVITGKGFVSMLPEFFIRYIYKILM